MQVELKKVLKNKEIRKLIIDSMDAPLTIRDSEGTTLYDGVGADCQCPYPVEANDKVIGWVGGAERAELAAQILACLANSEMEKKALVQETLEKYKEIAMLYEITEKLSENLDQQGIAWLVIEQAKKLIKFDNISVMLLNEESGYLEVVAGSGTENKPKARFRPGEGVAGSILLSGKAELLNDVSADIRYIPGKTKLSSLMCAPLKVKAKVLGIINISSCHREAFTSGDLKLLAALAFQVAIALQNSKLNFIKETFGRYLSDEIVKKLIESPGSLKLGGEKKQITIMMSDLRGFTALSERLSPETVVAMLNNFLGSMVDIIQKYHGTILEFIGDAIMAIFGAPFWTEDHAAAAIACALEMQLAMEKVNQWNVANGFPEIEMGIGLNTGQVIVGNIGSEKRTKYGCVGSQVNLASRIESYTVGGQIIISEETLKTSLAPVKINNRMEVQPKGIKTPIVIYDISGIGDPYQLFYEQKETKLIVLARSVPVTITYVEDKHCDTATFTGSINKLSLKEAVIATDRPTAALSILTIIKICFVADDGKILAGDIYAKVKKSLDDTTMLVQLTSMSQEGRVIITSLIKTA